MSKLKHREGSCLCGHVRFQTKGEPLTVSNCHCRMCQKATGAAFLTLAEFPAANVVWIGAGINNGLTGVASLIFWALFVQGCYEMFRLAMRNRYGGPFEAILAIFKIGIEYGKLLIYPEILIAFLVGAVVSGLATEQANRSWR